jgi:hypothetical protein
MGIFSWKKLLGGEKMSSEINLPETIYAQLCFIKKVNQKDQYYLFKRANIHVDVSRELGRWLKDNFDELNNMLRFKPLEPYDPVANGRKISLNLEEIKERWEEFISRAFKLTQHDAAEFDDIMKFKDGYIIYVQLDGKIYGQINKISTSYILPEPKGFFLTKSFKQIIQEEGVRLVKEADILFYPSSREGKETEFIVFNKNNFEMLFDYSEYKRKMALEFLKGMKNIFTFNIMKEEVLEALWDKNIINMVNKPMIKDDKQYNYDIQYLNNVKREYPDLKFQVDIEENKVTLPEQDPKEKKKAFIEVMKAVSYHYAITLDDKLLEVDPIRLIKSKARKPKKKGK